MGPRSLGTVYLQHSPCGIGVASREGQPYFTLSQATSLVKVPVCKITHCNYPPSGDRVHRSSTPLGLADGEKVLRLLLVAWDRRLVFSVGTSSTTGESDTVIWNEVHHKTEFGSNLTGHGFPDPGHLDNVLGELRIQGITEDEGLERD
ncbi:hypothetical protein SKAU_G00395270 [Synaphobranchus kaupii]|uniref:E3 ubiquitin-protein ligase n=1 Tax=Synaphobranchus kaupii TaxID=118154 RepID=A0A9Q1ECA3_SYNKA|nr:hypothetical protein SKAU_G00395270 [Synaphobranchus kaupii]